MLIAGNYLRKQETSLERQKKKLTKLIFLRASFMHRKCESREWKHNFLFYIARFRLAEEEFHKEIIFFFFYHRLSEVHRPFRPLN
jgi:hypothetical protein